jgi:hypothetical protein
LQQSVARSVRLLVQAGYDREYMFMDTPGSHEHTKNNGNFSDDCSGHGTHETTPNHPDSKKVGVSREQGWYNRFLERL